MIQYDKIEADPVRGPEIGRMYVDASPFITSLARVAYRQFADQVTAQFTELAKDLDIIFDEYDGGSPYANVRELSKDVRHGRLQVNATSADQRHPLLGRHSNDLFRAVHDYHGHYMTGRDFDRHGEEAAWVRHSQMFTGLGRRAMTTETRGQSSALCWILGRFPEQKAVLLPDWVSEIPERWS